MKKFLVIFSLFLMLPSYSADMLDVDYNFIDTAFDGIKPVTDKEFNDTINRLTPQPVENTFSSKLKTFLFGRKYGVETPPNLKQQENADNGGELRAIQEIKNGIHYIRLSAPVIGLDSVIPLGDYKIQEKTVDNSNLLFFYQGNKEYGKLKLKPFEDELKGKNDISYSRVDIVNDSLIRIVYSTISATKCAYARVYVEK